MFQCRVGAAAAAAAVAWVSRCYRQRCHSPFQSEAAVLAAIFLHCDQTGTQSLSATKKDPRANRKGSAVSGR